MLKPSWVEIPATNLERALAFYQAVFNLPQTDIIADDVRRIAIVAFPGEGRAGVSINQTANFVPSDQGVLVYFAVEGALEEYVARATAAGGALAEPIHTRPAGGSFVTVKDSEGNLVTLNAA